jgi:hypothetical protein
VTRPEEIIVTFYVVSLFTFITLREEMNFLHQQFSRDITKLFHLTHTHIPTCFLFDGRDYEHKHWVATYHLTQVTMLWGILWPGCWTQLLWILAVYSNTFIICLHKVMTFLCHINSIHPNIHFKRSGKEVVCCRMPSSGMLRRVALVRSDVSEERIDSIIKVTRISKLETTLAVSCKWSLQHALVPSYC